MKIRSQIIFAFILLLGGVLLLVALYMYMYTRIDYTTIDYLKNMQKGAFTFTDLSDDIDVDSIDDLGFEVKSENNIVIHYGRQIIQVNRRCLESAEFHERIAGIGLVIKHKTDEEGVVHYRIECWGEPVEEWDYVT